MERECNARHGDMISESMFEDLLTRIRDCAQQRRLEETLRKTRGDPMDIGLLNPTIDNEWYAWNQEPFEDQQWGNWGQ